MDSKLMQAYYETYNSEDPEALRKFYHDDVEFITSQGVQHGADAIIDTYRYLISLFHDKMTPDDIQVKGSTAVVHITDRFVAKQDVEDFMGMKLVAGESFAWKLRGSYEVKDGKFSRVTIELLQ